MIERIMVGILEDVRLQYFGVERPCDVK